MVNSSRSCFFVVCCMLLSLWLSPSACNAGTTIDRCRKYLPQMTREARYFIGMYAPTHLFMGQVEQESRCNEGITAFDGGQGLGQFMPATAAEVHERESALRELGARPIPYDPRWAIRALVLYDRWLYQRTVCEGWYFAFRAYNGGLTGINREILTALSCGEPEVEAQCKRRVLVLKSGSKLSLCQVNIDYPYQISRRSDSYRRVQ